MQTPTVEAAALRCVRCRQALVPETDLIPHQPRELGADAPHASRFARKKDSVRRAIDISSGRDASQRGPLAPPVCRVYHVEPQEWMTWAPSDRDDTSDADPCADDPSARLEGRIVCPGTSRRRCGAALGRWSWAGLPCSCGLWQSPCFMLHVKAVEPIWPSGSRASPSAPLR